MTWAKNTELREKMRIKKKRKGISERLNIANYRGLSFLLVDQRQHEQNKVGVSVLYVLLPLSPSIWRNILVVFPNPLFFFWAIYFFYIFFYFFWVFFLFYKLKKWTKEERESFFSLILILFLFLLFAYFYFIFCFWWLLDMCSIIITSFLPSLNCSSKTLFSLVF